MLLKRLLKRKTIAFMAVKEEDALGHWRGRHSHAAKNGHVKLR
jgi:hypothetical protein